MLMHMEETMGPKVSDEPVMLDRGEGEEDALEGHTNVKHLFDCFEALEWELSRKQSKKSRARKPKLKAVR